MEEDLDKIDKFRVISLLSVEGKIFFSVVQKRLSDYLSRKNYIKTSVPKGGIAAEKLLFGALLLLSCI